MKIANYDIKNEGRVFVIAEAGVNANGDLDLALKLVEMASQIGADAVKFQTFKPNEVCIENAGLVDYQKKNLGKEISQRKMIANLHIKENFYPLIIKKCQELGIMFLSTPHGGRASAQFLNSLDVLIFKVGSGDLTNYILLDELAKFKKPIILSTGMSTLKEVEATLAYLKSKKVSDIVVLHCTTNYPCPPQEVNMLALRKMMTELQHPIGYSDHSLDLRVVQTAALLGMALYEFHITLDRNLPGPDQKASATKKEALERIREIRRIEKLTSKQKETEFKKKTLELELIMGNGVKKPNKSELEFLKVRRSLIFTRNLPKGHIVVKEDLEAKRPGDAISPIYWEMFLGKKLNKGVKFDEQLENDMFSFLDESI